MLKLSTFFFFLTSSQFLRKGKNDLRSLEKLTDVGIKMKVFIYLKPMRIIGLNNVGSVNQLIFSCFSKPILIEHEEKICSRCNDPPKSMIHS